MCVDADGGVDQGKVDPLAQEFLHEGVVVLGAEARVQHANGDGHRFSFEVTVGTAPADCAQSYNHRLGKDRKVGLLTMVMHAT